MAGVNEPSTPAESGPGDRIGFGSIVIDRTDLPRTFAFYSEALQYVPPDPPRPDGVVLQDSTGPGPNVDLCLSSEWPFAECRLQRDLYPPRPFEEVDWLPRRGATLRLPPEKRHGLVTSTDPDEILLDVVDVNQPDDSTYGFAGRRA